jgi:N-carbamoyl-L-amino-acid hydrolase
MASDAPRTAAATIDADRLWRELDELAQYSDVPAPAVTRIVFSDVDRRAREYVKALCRDAWLEISEDPVGNTFARWVGTDSALPPIASGSHIDAIPNAGRFDGTVGVLGAIEAVRALQRTGVRPRRSIDVVMFTAEEPTRFGVGCLGSRLMSSTLDPAAADALEDRDGRTLAEVRAAAGFAGPLSSVAVRDGGYAAFVELHIEQGPILEQRGLDIGVVTAIAAPAAWRVHIEGEGGHAGAVLMPDRRDAFLAAAEIALAVEAAARGTGSIDTVGTVGVCDVFPGATNSVPSRTTLGVDVRDIDGSRRDAVLARIRHACDDIAAQRRVSVVIEPLNVDPPCQCATAVTEAIAVAAKTRGLGWAPLISRAYHDSLFMSRVAPTGMIFIPCRGGVSHRPDEYASPDAIARGVAVLADTLATLAGY